MASAATGLLTAMALAIATTAAAQDYPSRPVRIVVPYAAGGPSDTGTRLAAEPLGRELGRPIVIENRGGGGGLNATEAYVKSEHDGYTILVGAIGPLTIIPALKPVSYDPEKDFAPLGTVWRSAQVLAVRPSLGVKTMAEFVAYAKANPGKVTVGSAGVGAVTHLAIEVLKREASLDLIHVPFRSTSESLPALIGGQIDALVRRRSDHRAASAIRPHQLRWRWPRQSVRWPCRRCRPWRRPAMRASNRRAGSVSWCRRRRRRRSPSACRTHWRPRSAIPAYQASLAKQGASAGELGPDSFAKLIRKDAAKWRAIIKAAGIKVE